LCSDALASAVAAFRLPGARIVEKKSGKRDGGRGKKRGGVRLIDLAPLVRHISARGDIVEMTVKAGSVDNVKPELVLQALNKIYIESVTPGTKTATWVPCAVTSPGEENACGGFYKIWVRRTALYAERGGVLLKPIDDEVC